VEALVDADCGGHVHGVEHGSPAVPAYEAVVAVLRGGQLRYAGW
jgi:hypothetical protein